MQTPTAAPAGMESFAALFEESLKTSDMRVGEVISAEVVRIEHSHVVGALMVKIHRAKLSGARSVEIWGTGTPRREFLYGDDLADACVFLMERGFDGPLINIGTGSISVDPLFLTTAPGDYRLAPASPCRDAGDPAATYNDLDGSRNDLGATGGPCGSAAPPGSVVDGFLWTSVGTIPVADIDQTTGAKGGLTLVRDRPFGGQPWLYGPFGSNETTVYRYAIKVGKWTGSTPPAPARTIRWLSSPASTWRWWNFWASFAGTSTS